MLLGKLWERQIKILSLRKHSRCENSASRKDLARLVKWKYNDFNLDWFLSWILQLQEWSDWNRMINESLSETRLVHFFQNALKDQPRSLRNYCNYHRFNISEHYSTTNMPFTRLSPKKALCLRNKFLWKWTDNIPQTFQLWSS